MLRARLRPLVLLASLLLVVSATTGVASVAAQPVDGITGPGGGGEPSVGTRYLDEIFASVTKTSDIVFGEAPNYDTSPEVLELDLFEPVGDVETNRPALVFVHGGSFQSGDKSQGDTWMRLAAKRGYVGISINYRVVPGALGDLAKLAWAMPAAQHDTHAAIRWLRANARDLGINPTAIGVVGYSAGALTSMHVAHLAADQGTSGNPGYAPDVSAAVSLAGASIQVNAGAPPQLMFHGDSDPVVPYSWGSDTCTASAALGNECTLVTYPGGTHDLSPFFGDIRPKMWQFFYDEVVPALTPLAVAGTFHGLDPVRVLDTRDGTGLPFVPAGTPATVGPGETVDLQIAGVGGVPGTGAIAAVLNVTAVGPTAATHVTVHPGGTPTPPTSNLNLDAGETRAVLAEVGLGAGGDVRLRNNSGEVDLVADLVGWYDDGTGGGSSFLPVDPVRALDTRDGTGGFAGPLCGGCDEDLVLAGALGIPVGATAVAMNVTVVGPTAATHLTIWPAGSTMPLASTLNAPPGANVPNAVVAALGAGGAVSIFNNAGSSHVVVDITGYYGPDGVRFVPVDPVRALDTRDGTGAPAGPVGPGGTTSFRVRGLAGLPEHGVSAVVLSVTAVGASQATHVTVWPDGSTMPLASTLNLDAGATKANVYLGAVGGFGDVSLFNNSGTVHLVADVVGYLI